jgi:hypothetical protein
MGSTIFRLMDLKMTKYRTTSISKDNDDFWMKEFEKSLAKNAVQSKQVDRSLYDQISNIMNNSSAKYPSVEAAVEDMKQRSGLTAYLNKIKISEQNSTIKRAFVNEQNVPDLIKQCPNIKNTLDNIVKEHKGTLPILGIIEKAKQIHGRDVSENKYWDDDNLLKYVSGLNLLEKTKNYNNSYDQNLGKNDDIDNSNKDDAFAILEPVKF